MPTRSSRLVQPEASLIVIIGASDDVEAMQKVLADLPADFPAPVICLQQINSDRSSVLVDVLKTHTALAVRLAYSGVRLDQGVLVCPAASYPFVHPVRTLSILPALSRPAWPAAVGCLLVSTASAFNQRAIVVMFSGQEQIDSSSLHAINDRHGIVILQATPATETADWGNVSACADFIVTLDEIAPMLTKLVTEQYVPAIRGGQRSNCELLDKLTR